MMRTKLLSTGLAVLLCYASCSTPKIANNYYTHKTECVSVELDGTQLVNAWSNTGETVTVIEQAKKNAINDVLFGGIVEGKANCDVKPILAEANIKAQNEAYFNKFFADGGEYRNYAFIKDDMVEVNFSKDPVYAKKMINSGFIIKIKKPDLKQKMIADGILKQ
jgi:hypothetical protein